MSDNKAHDDDFDGIVEEDNPMPNWWLFTFLITIPFAYMYFIHYHTRDDVGLMAEYLAEKAKVERLIAQHGPKLTDMIPKMEAALGSEPALLSGSQVFAQQCAVCHGNQGEGIIGPNLTDNHFIHGNTSEDYLQVINEGATLKGMPAWGQVLNQEQMIQVSAYVKSLAGKMIPGKPPEGEEVSN